MKTIKDYRIAFWTSVVKAFNNEAKNDPDGYYASQPSQNGFSIIGRYKTVIMSIYIEPDAWDEKFAILDDQFKLIGYLDQRNDAKMIARHLMGRMNDLKYKSASVPSRYLR